MEDGAKIMDALRTVETGTQGQDISVGDMVDTLNSRGFGTILLIPPVITILPTGMIPGVPAACAAIIAVLAIQMVMGRQHPWVPAALRKFSIRRSKYKSAVKQAGPYIQTIDSLAQPRLSFLHGDGMKRTIALLCLGYALAIAVFGFIPFVPAILSLPILFFALGLSTRDGVFTILGLVIAATTLTIVPTLMKHLGG